MILYLAIVALDVWLLFVLLDAQMNRGYAEALAAGTRVFFGFGLVWLGIAAVALIPGQVLATELAAREPPPSRLGRGLAGAIGWSAWGALIAVSASSLSGLVLFHASAFAALGALAASGALIAAFGLDPSTRPPGRVPISVALVIVVVVVAGSLFMAGRWGGPA